MGSVLTKEDALLILQTFQDQSNAALVRSKSDTPFEVRSFTIDLTTAKARNQAMEINCPHKSFYVAAASDTAVKINMIPDTKDDYQDVIPLTLRDSGFYQFPKSKALFYWDAQPAKTVTILFFVSLEFRSGSNVTQVSSSVDANSVSNLTPVSVDTTAGGVLVVAQDLNTKVINLYNDGPNTCFLGASGVTAVNGFPLLSGQTVIIKNTAAIYGITSVGTATIRILKEV